LSFLFLCCGPVKKDFDILIVKGIIVDGSGRPGFQGDIGISGDIIVAIGDLSGKTAQQIIDAEALIVSPGFIDMHTHCDAGLAKRQESGPTFHILKSAERTTGG
jgi:N-acyl-D-aspartate/D-glutamate deacylase